jgi:hypothetical protein
VTWIAGKDSNDWHYISENGGEGIRATTGCGMVFAEGEKIELFSGEEEPYFLIFDPPIPVCQGCRDYRTLRELGE